MSFCERSVADTVEAARRHKDSTHDFMEKAYEVMKNHPYEISTGVSELGKLIQRRANAVFFEVYKLGCYVRLTPYPEMLLVGKTEPEHDSGYLTAFWLADRFEQFMVLVFTSKGYDLVTRRKDVLPLPKFTGKAQEEIVQQVRDYGAKSFDERLHENFVQINGDELWRDYYATQFLSQRKNLKAYHRDIPKYMFKKAGMELEREFFDEVTEKYKKNKRLDEYFSFKKS